MQGLSKQNFVNKSYPQLTVENVNYWYWVVDPHWSALDIAKAIGCNNSDVYYFMRKNDISIRSTTEANLNRFSCPQKYESYRKQRSSPEFREQQSIKSIEAWQDPVKRAKFTRSIREGTSKKISEYQRLLLFLLLRHSRLFLTDFIRITNLGKNSLYLVLSSLYKRELVARTKEYNEKTYSNYKYHFRYEITERGKELLTLSMANTPFNYEKLLKSIQARYNQKITDKSPEKKEKNNNYINIGKNQRAVLHVLHQQDRPLFLLDFVSLMAISQKSIDNSLSHLCKRGFLSREKEFNDNYTGNIQNAMQYRYKLTEKGNKLLLKLN